MTGKDSAWILYIEDSEDDVRLVREILPESRYPLTWAPTAAAARKHLEAVRFDLVLLDHGLPDSNGLVLLDEIRRSQPELPVLFLTGRDDEALASSAKRRGAADYLLKEDMLTGLPALVRATLERGNPADRLSSSAMPIATAFDSTDRISRIVLETMNEGSIVVDADGIVTFASTPAGRLLGCPSDALLGHAARDLFDEPTARSFLAFHHSVVQGEGPQSLQLEGRLRGGRREGDPSGRPVLLSGRSVRSELGRHEACLVVLADISELVAARNALRARIADLERLQRFFMDREKRIAELKARLREHERGLGIDTPRLSEETRRELERRLGARETSS